jgi:hypothetical protein
VTQCNNTQRTKHHAERYCGHAAENRDCNTDRNGSWASCGADLNGDGVVNVFDLSILESDWGTSGHRGDINLDGTVNTTDMSIMMSQWGKAPTPVAIPAP